MFTIKYSSIKLAFLATIIFSLTAQMLSTKYETKILTFNTDYSETLEGRDMKFYSVQIGQHSGKEDLLIDTQIIGNSEKSVNNFVSPLILVSLTPLPNNDKTSTFLCGELGHELCFVPAKYLSSSKTVYLGIYCQDCHLNIKTSFVSEDLLSPGESKLIHLKQGDSKVFIVKDIETNSKWLQIAAFNLRMTDFDMTVEKIETGKEQNLSSAIQVNKDWIGGKAATINNLSSSSSQYYRVILRSSSDSVINVEARTDSSLIKLNDRSLKFEGIKENSKVCYLYNVNNELSDIAIDVRTLQGEVEFSIYPNIYNKQHEISFKVDKEIVYNLTANDRKNKDSPMGEWVLCAKSHVGDAFFTLSVYDLKNENSVKEHKKLLYKLLKREEMYDLENLESLLPKTQEIKLRSLLQNESLANNTISNNTSTELPVAPQPSNSTQIVKPENPIRQEPTNSTSQILINGNGVAGISVVFLFLTPVIIGSLALMGTFVNTKFLDQPIKIKVMD